MTKKNARFSVAMVLGLLLACSSLSLIPTQVFAQSLWISQQDLRQLPQSGKAYEDMRDHADSNSWPDPGLTDNDAGHRHSGIYTLAGYYMWVITGEQQYLTKVTDQLRGIMALISNGQAVSGHRDWESHHTGRKLAPHVIAADGIKGQDPDFDRDFESFLKTLATFQHPKGGSPRTLMQCAEVRPNNIGTMCRLALVSIHAYLQDGTVDITRLINIQKGFLGDRGAYDNFAFGNLDWQCNPNQPVAINPPGCTIQVGGETLDVGGGQPEELRRGSFEFPLPRVGYHWTNLQGVVPLTQLLHGLGHPAWEWSNQAVKRALDFVHRPIFSPCDSSGCSPFPASGDDKYVPFIANCAIGTNYTTEVPAGTGRTLAWTDWTHGPNSPVCGATQNTTTPMPPENLSIQ